MFLLLRKLLLCIPVFRWSRAADSAEDEAKAAAEALRRKFWKKLPGFSPELPSDLDTREMLVYRMPGGRGSEFRLST
jgi:hypothetical protein